MIDVMSDRKQWRDYRVYFSKNKTNDSIVQQNNVQRD